MILTNGVPGKSDIMAFLSSWPSSWSLKVLFLLDAASCGHHRESPYIPLDKNLPWPPTSSAVGLEAGMVWRASLRAPVALRALS